MFDNSLHNKTIKSASELDYPPFSIVLDNKQASGFSVELLTKTINIMGGEVSFYVETWANIKKDLKEKKIDVLPVVGRTLEREQYFDFTTPYLVMHGAIFIRDTQSDIKNLADLKHKTIATMKGDNAQEYAQKNKIAQTIKTFDSFELAFKALNEGEADAVIVQRLVGVKLIQQLKLKHIKMVNYVLENFKQDFSFAVVKGDTKLLALLNEGLALLKANGEYEELYKKWFQEESNPINRDYLFILIGLVTFFFIVSILFYLWNRSLQKLVNLKTSELTTLNKSLEHKIEIAIKEIEEKNSDFKKIIELTPCPIMLHNEDGNVILMNKAWCELSGFEPHEIQTIQDWINHTYIDEVKKSSVKAHIQSLYSLESSINEGEFSFINKDKALLIWSFSSAPFGIINGKKVIVTSAMDITELKKADELMIAQSRTAAMGEMLSMIAHQWRQPLSIISMNVNNTLLDLELDKMNKKSLEENLNSTLFQVQHLSKTIDDFKDFFKPNKEKDEVSLETIFKDSIQFVSKSLENHNIQLSMNCKTEKKVSLYSREIIQVFINILNNAKDALNEKNPSDKKIMVSIFEIKNFIRIEICNNGNCIKEENLSKIFNPYFSTKDQKNGTGLGLYISKMIIEKHMKGQIYAKNREDGVCFLIDLPI